MRGKPITNAQHFSTLFGTRAYFRTSIQEPAVLVIDDIKRHDAAIYRCRVDFHRGQSRSVKYNLTVVGEYYIFIFDNLDFMFWYRTSANFTVTIENSISSN